MKSSEYKSPLPLCGILFHAAVSGWWEIIIIGAMTLAILSLTKWLLPKGMEPFYD